MVRLAFDASRKYVDDAIAAVLGGSSSSAVDKELTQTSHGFVVGNVIRFNGTDYVKSQADSGGNSINTLGLVSEVIDVDTFKLRVIGYIDGLSGLTPGLTYFLSDTVAGGLTADEPTATGSVSKPMLIAVATGAGFIFNFRSLSEPIFSLFSRNTDGDLQPIDEYFGQVGLFEIDTNEDLQPVTGTVNDTMLDLDSNDDIEPKP